MRHISLKRSISIIVMLNKFIFIKSSYLEYILNGDISVQNDLYCCIVTMPPRPSIPSEEVQINDTDTGPENTQEPVGSSNPILIGQLRMIQVVSASDSFEETSSSSDDSYSEDSEVTRGESRQQSSLQAEPTLSLIDAADEIANSSSNDPLQTGPSMQGSDVKSTWEISSTTNPFYESNERPGMENSQEITPRAPSYPMFESLSARLRSFSNWPNHMTQTPHQMALAGFFYKGYGDSTQCFFCGGGIKEWEAGDDPLIEHARHFHDCAFAQQIQKQEFINLAKKRTANLNGQEHQEVNGTLHKYTEETSQNDQIDTCSTASSSSPFDDMTSLRQENTILRNQTLCVICVEEKVSIVFLPCGHLTCCEDCAPAMRKCPICREFVRGTVKTKAS